MNFFFQCAFKGSTEGIKSDVNAVMSFLSSKELISQQIFNIYKDRVLLILV